MIDEYMTHLKVVPVLLKEGGLTLMIRKRFFLQTRIECLGHILRTRYRHIASKTCHSVQTMQPPTNATQLRTFRELCNFDRRFDVSTHSVTFDQKTS